LDKLPTTASVLLADLSMVTDGSSKKRLTQSRKDAKAHGTGVWRPDTVQNCCREGAAKSAEQSSAFAFFQ
jgi:hypothetical protein